MSAITLINEWSTYLLFIIPSGGALSCIYQALKISSSDDETEVMKAKKNIKSTLKGIVLGLCVTGLAKTIFSILGN